MRCGFWIVLFLSFLGILFVGRWVYRYSRLSHAGRERHTIAIVSSTMGNVRIATEGLATLVRESQYASVWEVRPYQVSINDKSLITALCDNIINDHVDVVVTFGLLFTQIMVQQAKKRGFNRPILFSAVRDPVAAGIVDSLEVPGGTATGVIPGDASPDFWAINSATLLSILKPSAQRVLIPVEVANEGGDLSEYIGKAIRDELVKLGVKADLFTFCGSNDVMTMIDSQLAGHDTLMITVASALNQYNPSLVKLCRERGVTLFLEVYDGLAIGAAMGYGQHPVAFSKGLFSLLEDVLIMGENPGLIPVRLLSPAPTVYVNTKVTATQNYRPNLTQIRRELAANPVTAWMKDSLIVL